MNNSQTQQLRSYYIAIVLLAVIAVWLLSSGTGKNRLREPRVICSALAEVQGEKTKQVNTGSDADKPDQARFRSKKTVLKFLITNIDQSTSLFCQKQLGLIVPVVAYRQAAKKLRSSHKIPLELVLSSKLLLTGSSSHAMWRIKK